MLNGDLKKNAIEKFENAKNTYEKLGIEVGKKSEKLMNLRKNDAHNIITRIEALFSGIANKPKEFDKTFSEYKAEFKLSHCILPISKRATNGLSSISALYKV